jgi:hypothetical protein
MQLPTNPQDIYLLGFALMAIMMLSQALLELIKMLVSKGFAAVRKEPPPPRTGKGCNGLTPAEHDSLINVEKGINSWMSMQPEVLRVHQNLQQQHKEIISLARDLQASQKEISTSLTSCQRSQEICLRMQEERKK